MTITDTYDSRLTLFGTPNIYWVTRAVGAAWIAVGVNQSLSAAEYTFAMGPGVHQFQIAIDPAVVQPEVLYNHSIRHERSE